MARNSNQKPKLLYLAKILMELTDDDHGLSIKDMITALSQYDINADRKTLYNDIEELRHFGIDVVSEHKGRDVEYHIASRLFELPELKLLVDSVQSSRFLTERKSGELIKKLESLASRYEAVQLNRQLMNTARIKTMNESIYYNVDKIHTAIGSDRAINFQYFQWTVNKEMKLRHNGAFYTVSPWALAWDNENYYLIGYDGNDMKLKHFRVDKMLRITVTEEKRTGKDEFENRKTLTSSKRLFGMFAGEPARITIEAENNMAGIFIDRFGKDIHMLRKDDDHFTVNIEVELSSHFLGWIIALGNGVRITGPAEAVQKMREEAQRLSKQYATV